MKLSKNLNSFIGTFFSNFFIQGLTLVQGLLLARLLGPEGRGIFTAAIMWPNIIAGLGLLGSNIGIARISAKIDGDKGNLKRGALVFGVLTSLTTMVIGFFLFDFIITDDNLLFYSRCFLPFVFLNHITLVLLAIDLGDGNFKNFNLSRIILNPVYLSFLLIFFLIDFNDIFYFLMALLIANFSVVLYRLFLSFRFTNIFGKLYSLKLIFQNSFRFGLASMIDPIIQWADKVLLLFILGAENLGIYMVSLAASSIATSITNSTASISFSKSSKNESKGSSVFIFFFKISFSLWFLIGSVVIVFLDFLVPFLFGESFNDSILPAKILILASALMGLSKLIDETIKGLGFAFYGVYARVIAFLMLLIVSLLTQPSLIQFCAIFVVSQFINFIIMMFFAKKNMNFKTHELLPKIRDINFFLK